MLIAAIKNYFKYFLKFFKILGIIFASIFIFYMVFELAIYLPIKKGDLDSYNTFVDQMEILLSGISIEEIFTSDFLSTTLKEVFDIFRSTNANITFGTVLVILSAGIVIGAFYYSQSDCKNAIRNDIKNRDTAKALERNIFNILLSAVFWVIIFAVTYYWFFAIFLLPFMMLLFESLKTLIYTWYVFFRKYKFFQIVSLPNCLRLLAVNFILLYLHIMLFLFLSPYLSVYVLLLLALSFYAYIFSVTQFTATKFFVEKRAHRELKIAK